MKEYFVISCRSDGPHMTMLTREQLLAKLVECKWTFLKDVPDWEYMAKDSIFILKGSVVIPTPKKVVTEYVV
jgi:hypothetical protein